MFWNFRCSERLAELTVSKPTKRLRSPARRFLQQRGLFEHRLHRSGRLPEPSHALHPVEEGGGKRRAAEQVIIQKVQMPAGQAADLRQRGLDRLHIEFLPAFEEGDLVTEVADV